MKKIVIIGMGLGEGTLTSEAREAVQKADVLLGAPRMLKLCGGLSTRSYPCYQPQDVANLIKNEEAENFAVLVSGDVGFYSASAGMSEALAAYDLRFLPGISTVNAFFAKLGLPWQDAAFISAHGREMNVADTVRRNRLTFCLLGENPHEIGTTLCKAGFGKIKTYIGENLGAENERVHGATAEEITKGDFSSLTVLLFVNESPDHRTTFGIPDSSFARLPGIPMTKSETRAVLLSKLALQRDSICWDVGAGTGSVTVEAALRAHRGHVYAIERRDEAIPLIRQNCASFHLGNVTVLRGEAPHALAGLPAPDAVFIGGSGGALGEIIKIIFNKNSNARVVVTAVTVETVSSALAAFTAVGLEPEIIQLNVSRGKKADRLHLMEALNPVTILSAGGIPWAD